MSGKSIIHVDTLFRASIPAKKSTLIILVTESCSISLELFKEAQLKDCNLDKFRDKAKSKVIVEGESFIIENNLLYHI